MQLGEIGRSVVGIILLCDRNMPVKKNGKIQNSRPSKAIIAVWSRDMANNEKPRKENGVNEMRMPRWMCGFTKTDEIRNEHE